MLASGTRLGPYEIVAPLGAGGMGEVYRARDTRLGRDVAVKVLPQHLSGEPERRARFEREARTISALNHPHICVLHDVGREGDTDYLVMELVDGETLSARLARGALPPAEVLRLGAQVADALARAHRAGVVHRDLKPGNVMVTKSGAKLMDFGLARTGPVAFGRREDATQAPTETSPITGEGRILGTVPYMAPEQFEGHEADARTDIWALGCVLYEMATGTRAFGGASAASVMSAILRDEPAPLSARAPASPPALERLIRSCLAKDPDGRWQSAGDLARELEWLAGGGEMAGAGAKARRGVGAWWVLAALLVVVALAAALQLTGQAPWASTNRRRTWTMVGLPAGINSDYALSPDGERIAMVLADSSGQFRLFVRSLAAPDLISVAPGEEAGVPFWSPDSREIGFLNGEGELMRVGATGSAPRVICKAANTHHASWSMKGWIVFGDGVGPIMKVAASGGRPEPATVLDSSRNETGHDNPEFLQDGQHFMFTVLPSVSASHSNVRVGSLGETRTHPLMVVQSAPQGDGRGNIVFMREHVLYRQRIDEHGDRLSGEPTPLAEGPSRWIAYEASPVARVAGDRMVFIPAETRPTNLVWFRRDGLRMGLAAQLGADYANPVLSPDGHRVLVDLIEGMEAVLWLLDFSTGAQRRLTSPDEWSGWPVWSTSGQRIAYTVQRFGRLEVMLMDSDVPESTRVIAANEVPSCFVPGDQQVVLAHYTIETPRAGGTDLIIHDLYNGAPDRPYPTSPSNETDLLLFDGGHRAAFTSDISGRLEIYCDAFPRREHAVQLTYDGCAGSGPNRHTFWIIGDELLYIPAGGKDLHSVSLRRVGSNFVRGEEHALFDLPLGLLGLAPAPDGRRFLLAVRAGEVAAQGLTFVDHWDAPPDWH